MIGEELRQIDQAFTAETGGTLGVWARRLDGGPAVAYQAEALFPAASTIKVPVLYEVLRQAVEGRLDLGSPVVLRAEECVPGSGVLKDLTPGVQLSVLDLAVLMIIISDNTATNLLIDLVGIDAVNRSMQELGLNQVRLARKIFHTHMPGRNEASPAGLGRLMEGIGRRDVLTPAACDRMLEILRRQQDKSLLTRYIEAYEFEAEEFGQSPVTVASKSGWSDGVRNDIGIIWAPAAAYAVAILSRGCRDEREHPDNAGSIAVARASRAVYRHFTGE